MRYWEAGKTGARKNFYFLKKKICCRKNSAPGPSADVEKLLDKAAAIFQAVHEVFCHVTQNESLVPAIDGQFFFCHLVPLLKWKEYISSGVI